MQKNTRRELTESEIKAADRLKSEFRSKKNLHGLTYETAAAQLGWSTGNLNQYLNKHIPLNMAALIRICGLIPGASPEAIYPELFEGVTGNYTNDPDKLLRDFYSLDEEMQKSIKTIIAANRK